MATTLALNSDRTVWVTTYAGQTGRCYDISMKMTDEMQVTQTFTENELLTMLTGRGEIKGLAVPEFDNGGRPMTLREEAERVCDRVEAEEGQIPSHTHSLQVGMTGGITTIAGGPEHSHCHAYNPAHDFTEEVYGHKHPVGIKDSTGEYIVGTSVPV